MEKKRSSLAKLISGLTAGCIVLASCTWLVYLVVKGILSIIGLF